MPDATPYTSVIFGSLRIDVLNYSSNDESRIWKVDAGRFIGQDHRHFHFMLELEKGLWFGPMAPYVIARMLAADLTWQGLEGQAKPPTRRPLGPKPVRPADYEKTLKALSAEFDYAEFHQIREAVLEADLTVPITIHTYPYADLRNARALIFTQGLPLEVRVFRFYGTFRTEALWGPPNPKRPRWTFEHFTYDKEGLPGAIRNTVDFFQMLGSPLTREDLLHLKLRSDVTGPKDWSPIPYEGVFLLREDYGIMDVQPDDGPRTL